jgi:CheY-like chemotaxis protein
VLIYQKYMPQMANSAQEETLRMAIDLSLRANQDVRELMTTRRTYINRALAADYRLAFPFKGDWVAYEFPADAGRSGVLTQASMLAMFSHPGRSSPTKRGVALMDIFLCEPTPTPPANVDFSAVNDPTGPLTVRQRLMAHASNSACASCHTHSDPIGLSLEGFDTNQVASILGVSAQDAASLIDQAGKEIANQIRTDVLIIEDEPFIALDIQTLVEDLGHRVVGIARTHKEAVQAVRVHRPGLILADIQLADGSSGLEAVNQILEEFEVPVIFITAYPERFLTGRPPEPAFLITKPFSVDSLKAVISQALFFDRRSQKRNGREAVEA